MRRRNFLGLAIGAAMVAGWRPFRDLAGAGPGSDPSIGLIAGRTAELFRDPAGAIDVSPESEVIEKSPESVPVSATDEIARFVVPWFEMVTAVELVAPSSMR